MFQIDFKTSCLGSISTNTSTMFRIFQTRILNGLKVNTRQYCSLKNVNILKKHQTLNSARISEIKSFKNNLILRRTFYYDYKNNRIIFDQYMIGTCVIAVAYFLMKSFFVSDFVKHLLILHDKDGQAVTFKREVLSELFETFKEANIDESYKELDTARFDIGKDLEPSVEGSFASKYSVCFLVPYRMNCLLDNQSDEEDYDDLAKFCEITGMDIRALDAATDDDGKPMLINLARSIQLSQKARKFAQLWMIHSSWWPVDPHLSATALLLAPNLPYFIFRKLSGALNPTVVRSLSILILSFGYLTVGLVSPFISNLKYQIGLYNLIKHECKTDQKAKDMLEGAKEYFEKTEKLKQIVQRFTTNSRYKTIDQPLFKIPFSCYYLPNSHLDYLTKKL